MISNRKISLKMEYDAIAKYCPEFAKFHHLDFVWARLAVITRIFGFEIGTYFFLKHYKKHPKICTSTNITTHLRID